MDPINFVLAIAYVFLGILITAICMPLLQGKVKMNDFYGVRIKKSYESEENWYKINKFGARQLIGWAIFMIFMGVVSLFIPFHHNDKAILAFVILPIIAIIIPLYHIFDYVKTLWWLKIF